MPLRFLLSQFFIVFFNLTVFAQWDWAKINTSQRDLPFESYPQDMVVDDEGNVYYLHFGNADTIGTSKSVVSIIPKKESQTFITKFDRKGNRKWVQIFPGTNQFLIVKGKSMCLVNGALYVSIYCSNDKNWTLDRLRYASSTDKTNRAILYKFDLNGNLIWQKENKDQGSACFTNLSHDNKGHVIVAGWFKVKNFAFENVIIPYTGPVFYLKNDSLNPIDTTLYHSYQRFVMLLDTNGNVIWFQKIETSFKDIISNFGAGTIESSTPVERLNTQLGADELGNVYFSGITVNKVKIGVDSLLTPFEPAFPDPRFASLPTKQSYAFYFSFWGRINQNGKIQDLKYLHNPKGGNGLSLFSTYDDSRYIFKVDGKGNILFAITYTDSFWLADRTVGYKTNKSIGFFNSETLIAKLNTNGNIMWIRLIGNKEKSIFSLNSLQLDKYNSIYSTMLVAGNSNSNKTDTITIGNTTFKNFGGVSLILKLDPAGNKLWAAYKALSIQDTALNISQSSDYFWSSAVGGINNDAYIAGVGSTIYHFKNPGKPDIVLPNGGVYIAKMGIPNNFIVMDTVNPKRFCTGATISVNFKAFGYFPKGNVFTAYLSDSSGGYDEVSQRIGEMALASKDSTQLNDTLTVSLNCKIPAISFPTGKHHRIRIVASKPYTIGASSEIDLQVLNAYAGRDTNLCLSAIVKLNADKDSAQGTWSSVNPSIVIQSKNSPSTLVSNLALGKNILVWNKQFSVCNASDTVVVTRFSNQSPHKGYSKIKCEGDTVILTADATYGNTFLWSTGSRGQQINVGKTGIYTLSYNPNICPAKDTFAIQFNKKPVVTLDTALVVCATKSTNIGSNISGNALFKFSPGKWLNDSTSSNPLLKVPTSFTKDTSINFTLLAYDPVVGTSCSAKATTKVHLKQPLQAANLQILGSTFEKDNTDEISLYARTNNYQGFKPDWFMLNAPFSNRTQALKEIASPISISANFLDTTVWLELKGKDYCDNIIVSNKTRLIGIRATKTNQDQILVKWNRYRISPPDSLYKYKLFYKSDKKDVFGPITRFISDTSFLFTQGKTAFDHCFRVEAYSIKSDSLVSTSQTVCEHIDHPVAIPNVITPNQDGKNDQLVIENIELYPENQLTVYNRWGKEVLQVSSYRNEFDTALLSDGVYYYNLKLNSSEQGVKGWFLVSR